MPDQDKPDSPPLPNEHVAKLGWRPDKPDQRDRVFNHKKVLRRLRGRLPAHVDLRDTGKLGPIYDQGNLGSCTGNASGKLYQFINVQQGLVDYVPSRLFIYYGAREIENTINSDAGAEIRDVMKVLANLGAPHEDKWPYQIGRFNQRAPQDVYDDAIKHQALVYESVRVNSVAIKSALVAGHPVVVGFTVYNSFWQIGRDGFMPVPKQTERVEGGHAVVVVGYKRVKAPWDKAAKDYAIIQNSWGETWGDGGCFYMPMSWLCNRDNADDFWTLSVVEG